MTPVRSNNMLIKLDNILSTFFSVSIRQFIKLCSSQNDYASIVLIVLQSLYIMNDYAIRAIRVVSGHMTPIPTASPPVHDSYSDY